MNCSNCGAELTEGTIFCPSCGSNLSASTPSPAPSTYDPQIDTPYTEESVVPPVAPNKRKLPLGLIIVGAIVAVLAIVVVVGLCTNWFGFYGPATKIALAAKNTVESGNFTVEMTTKNSYEGFYGTSTSETEFMLQIDLDVKKRELMMYGEQKSKDDDDAYTSYLAIYDGYSITGYKMDDYEYYSKNDISDELDEFFDAYEDTKELDWEELFDTISEATGTDLEDYLDVEAFEKCANAYTRKLNNDSWLKENAGYSSSKSKGVTYHEFKPNLYKFCTASLECFEDAFEDDDDYEEIMDGLKDFKSTLKEVDVEFVFGIKSNKLVEIEFKTESDSNALEVKLEFTDIGKTSIDEDELEDMLDKAESY